MLAGLLPSTAQHLGEAGYSCLVDYGAKKYLDMCAEGYRQLLEDSSSSVKQSCASRHSC